MSSRYSEKCGDLLHLDAALDHIRLLGLHYLREHLNLSRKDHLAELELILIGRLHGIDVHLVLFLPLGNLVDSLLLFRTELLPKLKNLALPSVRQLTNLSEELADQLVLIECLLFFLFCLL